ncbi:MAG: FAD binding domain-containing protein [Anaerolineae bacterium]
MLTTEIGARLWSQYYSPATLEEALAILAREGRNARIIAGGTDLVIELDRGVRRLNAIIDITRIADLNRIRIEDGRVYLGPLVTHNHVVASSLCVEGALPLAQAAWQVGAPQIRNRGTVAGNLITASPANDTITPLMALDASVTLASVRGQRDVPLGEFYSGVRRTVMSDDEMLTGIHFPALSPNRRGVFIKQGLRRAQAISVVNVAVVLTFDGDVVSDARIALGSVAPTVIRAAEAETLLKGRRLDDAAIVAAAEAAKRAARPIDDVRSPAAYRRHIVGVLTARALRRLRDGQEREGWPSEPALLWGGAEPYSGGDGASLAFDTAGVIETTVNGRAVSAPGVGLTLLDFLRDSLGLTGTKEGCAEGECGACTVFLDGVAIMACLAPAARAHGAQITTVEGLAADGRLHPVQAEFAARGAVQCGYCTPGFLMSAAKLLEEHPDPTREQVETAITGNLCRCTGYYKIVEAIEAAAAPREGD